MLRRLWPKGAGRDRPHRAGYVPAPNLGACDDTEQRHRDDRHAKPAARLLPPELWAAILDAAGSVPEDRYIQARVCRLWRSLVLSHPQARRGTPLRIGAQVCRARIAQAAVDRDDQDLLAWAVGESLAAPLPLKLVHRLWLRVAARDALGCAVVMRMAGPWPLPCGRPVCRCEADPAPTASGTPACQGNVHRNCRRMRLVLTALRHQSLGVSSLLLAWRVAHPARWVQEAAATALAGGHIGVLDVVWASGVEPHLPASARRIDTPLQPTWAQTAAEADRVASLAWVVDHLHPADDLLDQCLVDAGRRGASDAVAWLCQRQHFDGFARALVAATAAGHVNTLASMAPYAGAARAHLEAHGLSLDRVVTTTKEYKAIERAKRSPLSHLLAGRSLDRWLPPSS
ncbi:hypothetical protein pdul_cds_730 [Pandoravirus dulcis]|uniref:F-box incomplete domain containing protein n=1 Tax=Pandoravirus dulcis TaxID=1349409 RepID=S4VRA8_9VIRU|nr:hypothetical protein pdul_cds_730 [Pandoravirus dulcis]AGO82898.1 hypothetical protein pdul_cds_730 [Pandoravirus dulcis]